jgi:hypothetical protein
MLMSTQGIGWRNHLSQAIIGLFLIIPSRAFTQAAAVEEVVKAVDAAILAARGERVIGESGRAVYELEAGRAALVPKSIFEAADVYRKSNVDWTSLLSSCNQMERDYFELYAGPVRSSKPVVYSCPSDIRRAVCRGKMYGSVEIDVRDGWPADRANYYLNFGESRNRVSIDCGHINERQQTLAHTPPVDPGIARERQFCRPLFDTGKIVKSRANSLSPCCQVLSTH